MNKYETIHEAYLGTLADIFDNPDCVSSPRGQRVREKFNYQFTVLNPRIEPIVTKDLERNLVIAEYSKKEFDWYDSGDRSGESALKISKFWGKLFNPDGTLNSNYGYEVFVNPSCGSDHEKELVMISPPRFDGDGSVSEYRSVRRTPFEYALMCLKEDKDTRQAILRIARPEHQWKGNKDQVCTLHAAYSIRNNKLNLSVVMRSNDMTLGLVYDAPWFISLIYRMKDALKDVYPDLEVGYYSHYVHNIHVYDRDEEKVLKMLGRI